MPSELVIGFGLGFMSGLSIMALVVWFEARRHQRDLDTIQKFLEKRNPDL